MGLFTPLILFVGSVWAHTSYSDHIFVTVKAFKCWSDAGLINCKSLHTLSDAAAILCLFCSSTLCVVSNVKCDHMGKNAAEVHSITSNQLWRSPLSNLIFLSLTYWRKYVWSKLSEAENDINSTSGNQQMCQRLWKYQRLTSWCFVQLWLWLCDFHILHSGSDQFWLLSVFMRV